MRPAVHIVVPIYRGIALTRRCLESLAASRVPSRSRITLIDDASPEVGISEMLSAFVGAAGARHPDDRRPPEGPAWDLLRNATNRGFVASVNRGMALHPDHDIVLLNSDTEVPRCWLQRLQAAAYSGPDVGTVTPFSNSGSLASYPVPNVENDLPSGLTPEQLDRLFQIGNAEQTIDVPIGVGFCLFIRRDCLNDTGPFDEAAFGRGYGEENDFCLRASKRAWKHVLAADCFVFHKGRTSFGDEKDERVRQAYVLLSARYPHYPALIQGHITNDPARPCRQKVDAMRLAYSSWGVRLVVTRDSPPPGADSELSRMQPTLRLSMPQKKVFVLTWEGKGEAFKLWFRLPDEGVRLGELLYDLNVSEVCGKLPPGLSELSVRPPRTALQGGDSAGETVATMRLLNLVSSHSAPRSAMWQALRQWLATGGLRLAGSPRLRPVAAVFPQAVRNLIRQWIRANRS